MTVAPQRRPDRYRLYVDESGDHAYKLLDQPSHRYLALLGVWFRQQDDYVAFADSLEQFKRDMFGPRPDRPVVLHRSDIINRKGAFGVLRDQDRAKAFDAGLLQVVASARFRMVCVIIDKQGHLDRYSSPFHPYHHCMAAMMDRYSGWLNYKNAVGDVMAEARGREEDLQLEQAYTRVYESGTLSFSHEHHQRALTSKDIKIQDKRASIAGLQLADVLAHPVKQACLAERGLIEGEGGAFGSAVYEAAAGKFNADGRTGEVDGYGKVWLSCQ
jgi:hypothetical protein